MPDLKSSVQAEYFRQLATDNQNLNASVNSKIRQNIELARKNEMLSQLIE